MSIGELQDLARRLVDVGFSADAATQDLAALARAMRRKAAQLGFAESTVLLREMAASSGADPKSAALLPLLASHPGLDDVPADLFALYLLLWKLDIAIAERYSATQRPFDWTNPPREFWYCRTDTGGTHTFGGNGTPYLTNTIPAATLDAYYNCEIYNSTQTNLEPRNVLLNLFPVDSINDKKNFWYDMFLNVPFVPEKGVEFSATIQVKNLKGGSRGWGFWNTSALPPAMQVAWFIQFDGSANPGGPQPIYGNGFYAITQNGITDLKMPSMVKLPDLDEAPHHYRIVIDKDTVSYEIDHKPVARVTDPASVPTAPMAFHYWVDNAVFGLTKELMIAHILQRTSAPRANIMADLVLRSPPRP